MTNILVTGGDGQLGMELRSISESFPDINFIFTDIDTLDITDFGAVDRIISSEKPDYIINAAGYTAVDRAESEIEKAFAVNSEGVSNIVSSLSTHGGRLIQISTDYVFDGEAEAPYPEDYQPVPLSVYGKSKLAGEELALSYEGSVVIRTSWLYSGFGNNFLKTIISIAGKNNQIRVVNDQVGSPTYALDLAETILRIIHSQIKDDTSFRAGIYHYSSEGETTWFGFANAIGKHLGLDVSLIPVSTYEYPLPARRPSYSVLDKTKIKEHYSLKIPDWETSLVECLKRFY